MKPESRIAALFLFCAMCVAFEAGAAIKCQKNETLDQCWDRATTVVENQQVPELTVQQVAELHAKPTGIQTSDTNLKSNTTDFLPLITMSGLLGDNKSASNGTDGTYTFDLNFLIPGLARDKNSKLKAVVNSRPTVSEGIKQQIPEDQRDEVVKKIEAGLSDLADYTVTYTFSWIDRNHGRGFNNYEDRFAALAEAVSRQFQATAVSSAKIAALGEVGQFAGDERITIDSSKTIFDDILKQVGPEKFQAFLDKFEAAAARAGEALALRRQMFTDAGLESFAKLIDNQPQLNLSAQKHFRDPVLGGDETSGKFSFEWARANLNQALRGKCQRDLDTPATNDISDETLSRCLTQYTKYVLDNKANLQNGDKFSLSAEYLDIGKEVFDLPAQGLTGLKIDGARKLIISVGWSRQFPDLIGGDQPVRMDFVGSYENVSNDPMRRDRGVATLTITRKFGAITVPLGIVYANHGEFLGEVGKKLSAHVGLKLDLGGKETPAGQ